MTSYKPLILLFLLLKLSPHTTTSSSRVTLYFFIRLLFNYNSRQSSSRRNLPEHSAYIFHLTQVLQGCRHKAAHECKANSSFCSTDGDVCVSVSGFKAAQILLLAQFSNVHSTVLSDSGCLLLAHVIPGWLCDQGSVGSRPSAAG